MTTASFRHVLFTGALLVLAAICYLLGYSWGFRIFFLLGALFETAFWIRLLNRRYKSHQRLNTLKQHQSQ